MSVTPLKPLELPPLSNIVPINKVLNKNNETPSSPKLSNTDLTTIITTLETNLRSEFLQQMDQLRS